MVLDKGSEVVYNVSTAVQTKLDETGVSQNISHYAQKAAEGTKNIGSAIVEKSSETVHKAQEVPLVNDFT